jgi:RNA polymerase sigma factor (sigma-70 family)
MENTQLLRKIAWSFSKRTRVEFDDLLQEANLAYLEAIKTHDPLKSRLSTYVWNCVQNHLTNYIKQELKHTSVKTDEELEIPVVYSESIFDSMTKEAKEVVNIILDSPWELLGISNYRVAVRRKVRDILYNKGWEKKKVKKVFELLKVVYS